MTATAVQPSKVRTQPTLWVRCIVEIGQQGTAGNSYHVLPVLGLRPGQAKAYLLRGVDSEVPYKVVQLLQAQCDGRRHLCSCPGARFRPRDLCKHVKALLALGLFDG
jgi:hypothetical protein